MICLHTTLKGDIQIFEITLMAHFQRVAINTQRLNRVRIWNTSRTNTTRIFAFKEMVWEDTIFVELISHEQILKNFVCVLVRNSFSLSGTLWTGHHRATQSHRTDNRAHTLSSKEDLETN